MVLSSLHDTINRLSGENLQKKNKKNPKHLFSFKFLNLYFNTIEAFQKCTVSVKGFLLSTSDPVDVLVKREQELLSVDRPQFDSFVIRGSDHSLSISREVNAANSSRVSPKNSRVGLPVCSRTNKKKTKTQQQSLKQQQASSAEILFWMLELLTLKKEIPK